MSLRARLLIGLVVLVAIGLAVAAAATYEEQRSFLYKRVDQEITAGEIPVSVGLGIVRQGFPSPARGKLPTIPRGARLPAQGPTTFQPSGTYGVLLSARGKVLLSRSFTYGETAASPPALGHGFPISRLGSASIHVFAVNSRAGSGLRYRVAAFSVSGGRVLAVAVPLNAADQTLHQLVIVEGLVGLGVILGFVVLGWIVIQLGLRPLVRIERVASEIADGDLSQRVSPVNSRTEVGRLGVSLNEMLSQIERAFADRAESEERLRRFLADASHELRTPLASIRGYAELFRLWATSDPVALERAMARIESEAARMGVLVEDLLLLASLDEMPEMQLIPVNLRDLAEHVGEDTRAAAPSRTVHVSAPDSLLVLGDPEQLRQVLANLTRNAVIHTPAGSPIEVTVREERGRALLEVRDHGPGLASGAEGMVFDRFWRTEGGRSRGRGGAGLGLAIVKAIVNAHHGDVSARNAPDGGAMFTVILPSIQDGRQDTSNVTQTDRFAPSRPG